MDIRVAILRLAQPARNVQFKRRGLPGAASLGPRSLAKGHKHQVTRRSTSLRPLGRSGLRSMAPLLIIHAKRLQNNLEPVNFLNELRVRLCVMFEAHCQ